MPRLLTCSRYQGNQELTGPRGSTEGQAVSPQDPGCWATRQGGLKWAWLHRGDCVPDARVTFGKVPRSPSASNEVASQRRGSSLAHPASRYPLLPPSPQPPLPSGPRELESLRFPGDPPPSSGLSPQTFQEHHTQDSCVPQSHTLPPPLKGHIYP